MSLGRNRGLATLACFHSGGSVSRYTNKPTSEFFPLKEL